MNGEKITTSQRGPLAIWDNGAANVGGGSSIQSQLRNSDGKWDANYLLPQLVTGAAYPTHDSRAVSIWFRRFFSH